MLQGLPRTFINTFTYSHTTERMLVDFGKHDTCREKIPKGDPIVVVIFVFQLFIFALSKCVLCDVLLLCMCSPPSLFEKSNQPAL